MSVWHGVLFWTLAYFAFSFAKGFRRAMIATDRDRRLRLLQDADRAMRAAAWAIEHIHYDKHGRIRRACWRRGDGTEWIAAVP